MEAELLKTLTGSARLAHERLLQDSGLDVEGDAPMDVFLLLWDGDILAATGARRGNVLQRIAVAPRYQGQDVTATVLTKLKQDAFTQGIRKLFLYTKPQNQAIFESLFFYSVSATRHVALMEDERNGVQKFLSALQAPCTSGVIGAAVMNCNPFTLGHRHLIAQAAGECDWVYVFILSEEQGLFSSADRLLLARRGTADLKNVSVHPSGPYQISAATFPAYFLADKPAKAEVYCQLDLQVFLEYYVPAFHISRRYVGTEPLSPLTMAYNQAMAAFLPQRGVDVYEIPRKEIGNAPISASSVRALLGRNRTSDIAKLVPSTTLQYLLDRNLM